METELSYSIDYDELEMDELLGKGGTGDVYKATWRGAEVVVKVLKHDFIEEEIRFLARKLLTMK